MKNKLGEGVLADNIQKLIDTGRSIKESISVALRNKTNFKTVLPRTQQKEANRMAVRKHRLKQSGYFK